MEPSIHLSYPPCERLNRLGFSICIGLERSLEQISENLEKQLRVKPPRYHQYEKRSTSTFDLTIEVPTAVFLLLVIH